MAIGAFTRQQKEGPKPLSDKFVQGSVCTGIHRANSVNSAG